MDRRRLSRMVTRGVHLRFYCFGGVYLEWLREEYIYDSIVLEAFIYNEMEAYIYKAKWRHSSK